jgi:hypothetical protein
MIENNAKKERQQTCSFCSRRCEMLQIFRDYLDVFYPDFPDTDRKYDKWRFLKV